MLHQPRIACAVSWVPLYIPIFACQRQVSVIEPFNTSYSLRASTWLPRCCPDDDPVPRERAASSPVLVPAALGQLD